MYTLKTFKMFLINYIRSVVEGKYVHVCVYIYQKEFWQDYQNVLKSNTHSHNRKSLEIVKSLKIKKEQQNIRGYSKSSQKIHIIQNLCMDFKTIKYIFNFIFPWIFRTILIWKSLNFTQFNCHLSHCDRLFHWWPLMNILPSIHALVSHSRQWFWAWPGNLHYPMVQ